MSALTSRPLRVIHSEAATGFGGQEHRVLKEMRGMRDRGHHMEAICQPGSGLSHRLTDEGFKVYTLPMDGPVNYVRSLYRIRRLLPRVGTTLSTRIVGATPSSRQQRHVWRAPR